VSEIPKLIGVSSLQETPKNQKSGGTLALFEKDGYLSVSESVSEKAKLIRGDPPKIDFKKKGEPPKNGKIW
jgi:hypothetical protein